MKKIVGLILIVITVGNYSCERDDLCPESTQTTASLVIQTFDALLPDENKDVIGLRVQGIENNAVLEGYNVTNTSNIILPLRTDADETSFRLHKQYAINDNNTPDDTSDDTIEGNEDIITVTYIREDVFVSRACGYKTIFKNVRIIREDNSIDNDQWINRVTAENDNQIVENETEIHFRLFH